MMRLRKLLFIILLCLLPIAAYAGIQHYHMMIINQEQGAAPGGQSFDVDFTEYTAADDFYDGGSGPQWDELACDTGTDADCMTTGCGLSVDTTNDNIDGPSNEFVLLYGTQTDTITQYACVEFDEAITTYNGIYFRSDGNSSNTAYVVRRDSSSTDLQWRYCTGYSCTDVPGSSSCDPSPVGLNADDSMGIRVTGTGNDTAVEVWVFDDASCPSVTSGDVDTAWGSADCTLTADPGANSADVGKYVGLYNGSANAQVFDNFVAGDSSN